MTDRNTYSLSGPIPPAWRDSPPDDRAMWTARAMSLSVSVPLGIASGALDPRDVALALAALSALAADRIARAHVDSADPAFRAAGAAAARAAKGCGL